MPSTRSLAVGAVAGVVHAAALLVVARSLGYAVGPDAYAPVGLLWRYGGLVLVAAVPVYLLVRHRLVGPAVALGVTTGAVLWLELTPPGPTFVDVADLEGLAEPTGITVVENGLYVVRYMVDASVWLLGFLLLGLVEHVVRSAWARLPPVRTPVAWLSTPAPRRRAAAVAAVAGTAHAGVMTWFARRLGVTLTGGPRLAFSLYGAAGTWLLGAVPVYLLVRRRLVAPALLLAAFVLLDARGEFVASVDGPHALYFGAWFLYLAVVLVAAGVEAGLRRVTGRAAAA
ncbi:MAG: hypothetical protein ABEJ81_05940 [Haloferacaceae archaeon]